ncbi:MAG TPA: hypothetical protein VEH08_07185, partial [Methanomassiliicoccales archaeon]|nr:hypothetical protein [Methanomassiliicoccales archaeon]
YAQKCIDDGMPVENVSLFLGHKTTKTTEESYCRKKPDRAIAEAQTTWLERGVPSHLPPSGAEVTPKPKGNSHLIDEKKWIPGYA